MSAGKAPRPGFWPSRLSAADAAAGQRRYDPPQFCGSDLYWLQSDPEGGGRNVIMHWDGRAVRAALPAPFDARSRVNAYGGRAWTVAADGCLWFVNASDQALYRLGPHGRVARIVESAHRSFADLVMLPDGRLAAVCEEDGARQYLVAITPRGEVQRLHAGFDFYSSPRPSPDGRQLAWVCWNAPWMPWDESELWLGELRAVSWLSGAHRVAGGRDESWQQPVWSPGGDLHALGDLDGWWSPYALRNGAAQPLHRFRADCAHPPWVFGRHSHGFAGNGDHLVCVARAAGWTLYEGARPVRVDAPVSEIEGIAVCGGQVALLGAAADAAPGILLRTDRNSDWQWLTGGPVALSEPVSRPRRIRAREKKSDRSIHSWYFPPASATHKLRRGERPPLIVKVHGGPTAAASTTLDLRTLYWTSRGFGVLQVDYRGSSGAGRAFRQSLYGGWGRLEVEDCRLAALDAVTRKLADPEALFVSGSSAGGLTALNLLIRFRAFAAAVAYYGVMDLAALLDHGHRFEADYTRRLISSSGNPGSKARARSPRFHVDRIRAPVLLFQGSDDEVVPPEQSRAMAAALQARGIDAELLEFAGEGHGFRAAATIATALEKEWQFYCRCMGNEEMTDGR